MSNQPVVPDGMVMINGKLEKRARLSKQQHLENLVFNYLTWFWFWKSIYWWWTLAYKQYQKGNWRHVSTPVVLELFGNNPLAALPILESYGVYACEGSIKWAVMWNQVNKRLLILVAQSQWEFADNILAQNSCADYHITDGPGPQRGQNLPRPYTHRQKHQERPVRRAARRAARLGRTYS